MSRAKEYSNKDLFNESKKNNILIIGITGFLGRNLAKFLWKKYKDIYNIIGTGLSPNKIALFKSTRRGWDATSITLPTYCIDIVYDIMELENIFKNYRIDYVIHTAALKYIDIATKDPIKAINVNIIGSLNVFKLANKYNVKNLISISTDKANNPINTYGMTKYLMQEMSKQFKFSIYQGVNFFWSDGSVLDIWTRQIKKNEKLSVTNFQQERYYSDINIICTDIIKNLDNKNSFIIPSKIFKIKLIDLFNAIIKFFKYDKNKCFVMGKRTNEKKLEDLWKINSKYNISNLQNQEEIIKKLEYTYINADLSFL